MPKYAPPFFLPIVTPTLLILCAGLRSMYSAATFQLLTMLCVSGDNFGTQIHISMWSASAHSISPKGVQIQEGEDF